MKEDVENIDKKKPYGDQYMKLLILNLMKKQIFFQKLFQNYVKKHKSTSFSTIWSQSSLKNNGYGTIIICTSGHGSSKGSLKLK